MQEDLNLYSRVLYHLSYVPRPTCLELAWYSALIGYVKDWIAQYWGNGTERDVESMCLWLCFPVVQHYKVVMNAHCHVAVLILI